MSEKYEPLKKLSLSLTSGNINIGQHALTVLEDGRLLVYNNGQNTDTKGFPTDNYGLSRDKTMISLYVINENNGTVSEDFNITFPYKAPYRGCVEQVDNNFIVCSIPEEPSYNSITSIYSKDGNLLFEAIHKKCFGLRAYAFNNRIVF